MPWPRSSWNHCSTDRKRKHFLNAKPDGMRFFILTFVPRAKTQGLLLLLIIIPIPANFFWNIGVRFLSWECWDFCKRHDHFRIFPKQSEVFRWRPSVRDAETAFAFPSPSLRTRTNASSLPVLFISKIRDREEGIVIYSFYTWFSFLTWVWVYIFLEIVSSKTATTHIFQSGVRNWPASVSRREIEVFDPQAWDSRLRRESWQVYDWVRTLNKICFLLAIP